jgi:carbon starvation protein
MSAWRSYNFIGLFGELIVGIFLLILVSLLLWIVYRLFASRFSGRFFQASSGQSSPARRYMDGYEFFPVPATVLFGYQWMAASLEPVFGVVIAAQFGWLPALIWLVLATILMGWVQSFTLTIISLRNAGADLGELAERLISPATRKQLISLTYVFLVITLASLAAFSAPLISRENVAIGVLFLLTAGVLAGQLLFRQRAGTRLASLITVPIALAGIVLGNQSWAQAAVRWTNSLGDTLGISPLLAQLPGFGPLTWTGVFWTGVLLTICYLGAILPVWRFAVPVNYLAAWFGLLCIAAAAIGLLFSTFAGAGLTRFEIPALILNAQSRLGPIWPVLCVTLTGGAISGWHALVVTFSTSRLLDKPGDALPVSVGGTFMGTILALLALILAASMGVSTGRYDPSREYQLVAGTAGVFVSGMGRLLSVFGLPAGLADGLGVTLLALLAITSLQLAVRFMRQISAGWFGGNLPVLKDPAIGAGVAVLLAYCLAVFGFWQWLWVLFGSAGLIIAGLALLLAALWLKGQGNPSGWLLLIGMLLFITGIAAVIYQAGYQAFYQGLIMAGGQTPGARLGYAITTVTGAYLVYIGLNAFLSGISKFFFTQIE